MTQEQRGRPKQLTRDEVDEALVSICRQRTDTDQIVVSVNEISSELEVNFDKDVSPVTIRRRGIHRNGYYEKKYPEICSYQPMGDTRFRGLVIKREEFLEEVAE